MIVGSNSAETGKCTYTNVDLYKLQPNPGGGGTVLVFGHGFALEAAIGFHAFAPLEASMRVTNTMPLECSTSCRLTLQTPSQH
jgi:hypothetical protein